MRARLLVRDLAARERRKLNRLKHVQLHGKHGRKCRARGQPEITHLKMVEVDVERQERQSCGSREKHDARPCAYKDQGEVFPKHHDAVEPHLQKRTEAFTVQPGDTWRAAQKTTTTTKSGVLCTIKLLYHLSCDTIFQEREVRE